MILDLLPNTGGYVDSEKCTSFSRALGLLEAGASAYLKPEDERFIILWTDDDGDYRGINIFLGYKTSEVITSTMSVVETWLRVVG